MTREGLRPLFIAANGNSGKGRSIALCRSLCAVVCFVVLFGV